MPSERLQVILEMVTGQYRTQGRQAAGVTREVASSAEKAGGAATGLGGKLDKLSRGPLVGVAAGGFAAKKAFDVTIGAATGLDKKMTESLAIMGDVSDAMRGDMSQAARDVAKATTFSAEQAAESYFFLASAGLDAQQSIDAMPAVARFAQAGMFDMALATDLATDAQSALGLASDDSAKNLENLTRVTDVFTKANALANTSVQQVAEAMTNKAGAALRNVGKDLEEGTAVLAAYADQGLKGAAAGEALNIVIRDLQRAALGNEEAFARAGIAVFDQAGNMRNLADIVGELEGRLDGMSDAQVRAELTALGFQDRSISNLQTLLGTSDAIREYERELRSAGGATKEVADKQLESAAAKWDLFKSKLQDVGIEVGEKTLPTLLELLPTLEDTADGVGDIVVQFTDLLTISKPVLSFFTELNALLAGQPAFGLPDLTLGIGDQEFDQLRLLGDFLKGPIGLYQKAAEEYDEFMRLIDNGPGRIRGFSTGLENHNDVLRRATSGYMQMGDNVGSADDAMLNMARRTAPQVVAGMGEVSGAVANTAGPLGGLIGDLLEAQAAADGVFDTLRSAADPVFAAVDAWNGYVDALKASQEEGAGVQEDLDVLRSKVDLQSALERLGSDYDSAMQALSLATGTPIAKIEEMLELIEGFDGETFTATFETQFRSTGTPPPGTGGTSRDPGVLPQQHGGEVSPTRLYRGGELNKPEVLFIPGDRGRVFPTHDARAIISAFSAAMSGGGAGEEHLHITIPSTGESQQDMALAATMAGVVRRTETRRR